MSDYPFLHDRIKQFTYTAGAGNLELTDNAQGFSAFSDVYSDGDKFFYAITDGTRYEIGSGVYISSTNEIERHCITNSNGNSTNIAFPNGKKEIFVTYPATHSVMMGSGIADHNIPSDRGIAFWKSSHTLSYDSDLYWNDTLKRLGIRTKAPDYGIDVKGDGSNESMIRASGYVVGPTGIHFPAENGGDSSYAGGIQYKHFVPNSIGDNNLNAVVELSGEVNQIFKLRSQNAGNFFAGPIIPEGCSNDCGSALPSFRPISFEDLPQGIATEYSVNDLRNDLNTISGVVYGDLQDISRTFSFNVPSFNTEQLTLTYEYPEISELNIASGYSLTCTVKECTFDSQTHQYLPESVALLHSNLTESNGTKYINFNFYNHEEEVIGGGDAVNEFNHVFSDTTQFYISVHVDIQPENYPETVFSEPPEITTTTTTTAAPQVQPTSNAVTSFSIDGEPTFFTISETDVLSSGNTDTRTINLSISSDVDNSGNERLVVQAQALHPSGSLYLAPSSVQILDSGVYSYSFNLPLDSGNFQDDDTLRFRLAFESNIAETNSVNSFSAPITNSDLLHACVYHGGQNKFDGVYIENGLPLEFGNPDYTGKYTKILHPPLTGQSFYSFSRMPSSINLNHILKTDCCITNNFFAVNQDGDVYAWGDNSNSELGNGSSSSVLYPSKISGLNNITDICGGFSSAIALRSDGKVYRFGSSNSTTRQTPQMISSIQTFTKISTYDNTFFAINDNNELFVWGNTITRDGQNITAGVYNGVLSQPAPLSITIDGSVIPVHDISCGMNHLLIRSNNNLIRISNGAIERVATNCSTNGYTIAAGNEVSYYITTANKLMCDGHFSDDTTYDGFTKIHHKLGRIFASKVLNSSNNACAGIYNRFYYAAGKNNGFITPSPFYENNDPYSITSEKFVLLAEFLQPTISFFSPYETGTITMNRHNFILPARKIIYKNISDNAVVTHRYTLDTLPAAVYSKSNSANNISSNWGIIEMLSSGNISNHLLGQWGTTDIYK
jgi:hypothetical protein